MSAAAPLRSGDLASGKGHRDENFPVASWLLKHEHRAPVLAFYRFARAADDVADNADAPAAEKLRLLDAMRRGLNGATDGSAEALALRDVLAERSLSDIHARELLDAFTQDVTVDRYADWDGLIGYCRLSAMPVGRFVLDVHGEDAARTWPASNALCAALQIVNHLQDCGKDWHGLGRVYLPTGMIAAAGARVEDLGRPRATPALLDAIRAAVRRTQVLLHRSAPFAALIRDRRLAAEVAVIQRLAEDLCRRLLLRDPLSERVHHRPAEALRLAAAPALRQLVRAR
jgi:squalene synthase HpnC